MAVVDQSGIRGKIRDKPITGELERLLESAADATNIDVVFVTSGGQPGSTGRRTGSTRHDGGRAADLQLIRNGQTLTFTNRGWRLSRGVRNRCGRSRRHGYRGSCRPTWATRRSMSVLERRCAIAPNWSGAPEAVRRMLRRGCDGLRRMAGTTLLACSSLSAFDRPGRYVVIARGGLQLRKGPGLDFGITKTLETHTELTVLGFDGSNGDWARVDLENDGLVDGHVFASFLRPVDPVEDHEGVEEPDGAD